jgi:hypothetical protein
MRIEVSAVVAALAVASVANAGGLLWDNDLISNGFNARAVSGPVFPDIRVADDFRVPAGSTWRINDFHATAVEDAGWLPGSVMAVYLYADNNGAPGAQIQLRNDIDPVRNFTGRQLFGRNEFSYWAEFPEIVLTAGRYWIGFEFPNAAGAGTNYWTTSNGGQGLESTGYFSLDNGNNWQPEGAGWHHTFQITGVPAPGALALFGLGGLLATRRRRR